MNLRNIKEREKKSISLLSHHRIITTVKELLFFIYLLLDIVYINNMEIEINEYISLLNYLCVKYMNLALPVKQIINSEINLSSKISNRYLHIFFDLKKEKELTLEKNKYKQRIIFCRKISKTREKGRIYKYKVIIITYSASCTWFGIGSAKNFYLQDAIYKARMNSFKNIFSLTSKRSKYTGINNIYIKNSVWDTLPSSSLLLQFICESFRYRDIVLEAKKLNNIPKLLNLICNKAY